MAGSTIKNVKEVEDSAPKFGLSPVVAFGAPYTGPEDAELTPGWWADS